MNTICKLVYLEMSWVINIDKIRYSLRLLILLCKQNRLNIWCISIFFSFSIQFLQEQVSILIGEQDLAIHILSAKTEMVRKSIIFGNNICFNTIFVIFENFHELLKTLSNIRWESKYATMRMKPIITIVLWFLIFFFPTTSIYIPLDRGTSFHPFIFDRAPITSFIPNIIIIIWKE